MEWLSHLWQWFVETLRANPSIAIFLTIGIGFWIGKFKYKTFSLGNVTSVLLVGVLVGQLDIQIGGPVKNVFFLMFLFAIGYSVGPQFFRSLRGSGLKEVGFAVVMCVIVLLTTVGAAKLMGYNIGEAIGLFSGTATISAAIGVGTDTMSSLGLDESKRQAMVDIIPVAYAVTYIFGTIGSAYILSSLGPWLLGGLKKVREDTRALEAEMNSSSTASDPAYFNALRPVAFRAYNVESDTFDTPMTVADVEKSFADKGRRLFVERVRIDGKIVDPSPDLQIKKGYEIVLSGRREFIVGDESWIGREVNDPQLLSFPVEQLKVLVSSKGASGMTIETLRSKPYMQGVAIKSLTRAEVEIPVLAKTTIEGGDTITLVGLPQEVNDAAPNIGYVDRPSNATNLILLGIGITLGCLIGVLAVKIGNVSISLSTSGGALISGLVCGWLRSRRPSIGAIPSQAIWVFNNLGLNTFIAVIGITSGPSFVSGIHQVGFSMFLVGIAVTSIPLILGVIIGSKLFKFRPAINLGCCAGARTTTAALGAVQDAIGSSIPAMGYTVTYAIGNTLLILWGVVIVLMMA